MGNAAVSDLGAADPSFDRFARLVRRLIGVPVAMVTIVEDQRQVFPGAIGLPEPWQTARESPLSHSLCQLVVADSAPLVVSDTRLDERTRSSGAVDDMAVIAYAGYPLRDARGAIVGSLCAIDREPRKWTDGELATLEDLAAAASSELALREQRRRADEAESLASRAWMHASVLLTLSEALADTGNLAEVADAITRVATSEFGVTDAELWVRDEASGELIRYTDPDTGRPRSAHPSEAAGQRTISLPLQVGRADLGAIRLRWSEQQAFDEDMAATLNAFARYAAQACQRATLLTHRTSVAMTLQQAMLTALPEPDHLELAAQYLTAATDDQVGGDWYDALVGADGTTTVVIGDVMGHDVRAAAAMGQLRNLVRAFAWDNDDSPSTTLNRLDRAMRGLGIDTLATVFVARISALNDTDHLLEWSSAGHPLPVVVLPDGRAVLLQPDHDPGSPDPLPVRPLPVDALPVDALPVDALPVDALSMWTDRLVGLRWARRPRRDHRTVIGAGSTVVLYTDGLIETGAGDLATGTEALLRQARGASQLPVNEVLPALCGPLVGTEPKDDVATLAIRFHRP